MPRFAELATVTRREIKDFDPAAKELVAAFHAAGWRSYKSHNGHAIMYAPDGVTTASVSGHSGGPHLSRAARADLERWLRQNGHPVPRPRRKSKSLHRTLPGPRPRSYETSETHEPEHENRSQETPMTTTTAPYACPDCPEREPFKSGGALALHRQRSHDGMTCPECGEKFMGGNNAKAYMTHRLEKHGIEPRKKLTVEAVDGEYPCPWHVSPWNCDQKFPSMSGVASHIKVHRGLPRPETVSRRASKASANGASKVAKPTPEPAPAPSALAVAEAPSAPVETAPSSEPAQAPAKALVATGVSTDLDAWLGDQDPTELLANVLAVLAPPLVGQIERLRRERDELTKLRDTLTDEVTELTRLREENEARMALVREAFSV